MSKKKSPERKEFERMKRKGDIYRYLGGKKPNHNLHHKKQLSKGGGNNFSNIVQILTFAHVLLHKYDRRKELAKLKWHGAKSPSIEKTYDVIADGLIEKIKENQNIQDVINEMKNREKK